MIHWLVQSLADHPDLARGVPPPGLLSPQESARLTRLRVAKRRRDWLLGRWTAKHLLQTTLGQEFGLRLPLSAYTIENDAMGAPLADFDPGAAGAASETLAVEPDALSLSISHSGDHAFCALSLLRDARIGADIESIEDRGPEFVDQFFTDDEKAAVVSARSDLRPMAATAIWSAKEATLKALRLGLRVDTRRISCPITPEPQSSPSVPLGYLWSKFEIKVESAIWQQAGMDGGDSRYTVTGWWQIMSNYVLTLVLIS